MIGATVSTLVAAPVLIAAGGAGADTGRRWAAEVHLGGAWNLPLPLLIRQTGHDDLSFRARWETRAFEPPLYYVGRILVRGSHRGWALDLVHHKVHLTRPPAAVQSFAVSHGYNLLMVHRLVDHGTRHHGLGAGLVIAHPENEVRGRRLGERGGPLGRGYYLAGPVLGALASWQPARRGGPYPTAGARFTIAYARVPVVGGHARVPNLALHVTLGVGWAGAP